MSKSPILLFTGSEVHLMEDELRRIKKRLGDDALMNYSAADGESLARIEDFIQLCHTVPFLSEHRLMVLRNIQKLKPKARAKLLDYAHEPAEFTTLILTLENTKTQAKDIQTLRSLCKVREFKPLAGGQLVDWMRKRAATFDKNIDNDAAYLLAEITGADTGTLATEVDKLCLYAGDEKSITRADVERVVMRTDQVSVFTFLDDLFNRKPSALKLLVDLEREGIEPLQLISLLEGQTLQHIQVLGFPGTESKIKPFVARKIQARKKLWSSAGLQRLLHEIRTIEHDIKTGRVSNPFIALTNAIAPAVMPRR